MKKILYIPLIIILTLSISGCQKNDKSTYNNENNKPIKTSTNKVIAKNYNEVIVDDTDTTESKTNEELSNKTEVNIEPIIEEKENSTNELMNSQPSTEEEKPATTTPNTEIVTQTPSPNPTPTPDNTERRFKIVTKNSNYEIVNDGEIVTIGLGVAENLKEILSTLSTKYFNGYNIELSTIENINSQKIAVINLTGDELFWNQKMQGSLGGSVTEYTLIENVLQRDYPGYWINGVRFTINNKPIIDNGHTPGLASTTYR